MIPEPTPETQHYWDGAKERKLLLQCCDACENTFFPPRPACPACGSRNVVIRQATGRAFLYSYVISHVGPPDKETPFIMAIVELEEGPRMLTNIVGVPARPYMLPLDSQLIVDFQAIEGGLVLPVFRPGESAELTP